MAAGVMAGAAMAANVARLRSGIAAANEAWAAVEGRGLTLGQEEVGALRAASGKQRPFLKGSVGGCAVEVHIRSDLAHIGTTEITAVPPHGVDAVVGVHPSAGGLLGYLRSWLGQDIEVGDEFFDEQFLVTGKPASAAMRFLDPAMRARIVALVHLVGPRFAGLRYGQERVVLVLAGVEAEAEVVDTAVDVACAAAAWAG